jgi:hypothetical protein
MKKALWITSLTAGNKDKLIQQAAKMSASILVIRSSSTILADTIADIHKAGMQAYSWRWPATKPLNPDAQHYYALNEAEHVATNLIPKGLDGYIVDPESDHPGDTNDWNDKKFTDLAEKFCERIRSGAPASFVFGLTSGCRYPTVMPDIPYGPFVDASDALFPQTYWKRIDEHGKVVPIHGGTPHSSHGQGIASWQTIAKGKPIVAIGGELAAIEPPEVAEFGALIKDKQEVAHFFSDGVDVSNGVHDAIAKL